MPPFFNTLVSSFVFGLLTPLTAVCVLPLYPGFLAFLSSKVKTTKGNTKMPLYLGLLVSLGVIIFMFLLGLIFTKFLQISLTKVIGIVSPIAFGILVFISIFLIFDLDFGKYLPKAKSPALKNPLLSAFFYGFFFGAIIIPCNPAFIAAFFITAISTMSFITNMLNFILFGLGISFPLLVFAAISSTASRTIIGFLTKHKTAINRIAGIIMLIISTYYLLFVFRIFG